MPGSDVKEFSEPMERLDDRGRGDEGEEGVQGEWDAGRADDRVERQDCWEDLDGGMSIPSNFTLCLNYKGRRMWRLSSLH